MTEGAGHDEVGQLVPGEEEAEGVYQGGEEDDAQVVHSLGHRLAEAVAGEAFAHGAGGGGACPHVDEHAQQDEGAAGEAYRGPHREVVLDGGEYFLYQSQFFILHSSFFIKQSVSSSMLFIRKPPLRSILVYLLLI